MAKLARLNQDSLRRLLSQLEEKTQRYVEVDETGRVAELMNVLKGQIHRLLDKWAPMTEASDGRNDHDVAALESKKDLDQDMQDDRVGTIRDFDVD